MKKTLILLLVFLLVGCRAQIEPPVDNDCDDDERHESCIIEDDPIDIETEINELISSMSLTEKSESNGSSRTWQYYSRRYC